MAGRPSGIIYLLMFEHWYSVLGLTSLAVTAFFGAWSLFPAYRAFRYPACITYVHRAFLPFFGSAVQSLPDLSIEVDGQPIGENVVLLQGALVCRGTQDVTASMVIEPLTLQLKHGWRWLAVGKIEASSGLKPEITIERAPYERAVVNFGPLFRRGEYIAFTALLQMDDPGSREWSWWWSPVSCDHRIADTHVDKIAAPDRSLAPALSIVGASLLYAILLGLFGFAFMQSLWPFAMGLALTIMVSITNIGAHIWRLRVARVLPRHLLPESLL
jgi:hypothetical protein